MNLPTVFRVMIGQNVSVAIQAMLYNKIVDRHMVGSEIWKVVTDNVYRKTRHPLVIVRQHLDV